jgi:hypothetical protein
MPAHTHLAYRRNAQAAAQNHKVRKRNDEDLLLKARVQTKIVIASLRSLVLT